MITMRLVHVSKQILQHMQDGGLETLLKEVSLFYNKYDIHIPNWMNFMPFQEDHIVILTRK